MFILKNVVAKLWMTIIALVAVVLLILGLFLFQYIDTSFPKSTDQRGTLERMGLRIAAETAGHLGEPDYLKMMNDILGAQDAGMILLDKSQLNMASPLFYNGDGRLQLQDVFSLTELEQVFAGSVLRPVPVQRQPGRNDEDYIVMAAPVRDAKGSLLPKAVIVYQSLKSIESTSIYVKKLFALVSLIGFLLTTFFAFFLITRITRPLLQLNKAADMISHGEYGTRVPVMSGDEIGQLAKTFNLMGVRLEETITDLNHEKDNLTSVLRSMADAVISFDVEGSVIFANPHGRHLIGEWNGIQWSSPDDTVVRHQTQIPEPLQPLFERVVGETMEQTTNLHVQSGVWSIVMAPLYSGDVVRGVVAVLRDVTEEYRLDKLRKDFIANISHELRTPISMLQGYSEALLDDIAASPEERQELVQVIHDESLRMGRLVRDLLDLARMEAGHMEFNFQRLELSPLIRRVHRKFQALCKEQGILLETKLPDSPLLLGRADEDRLEQVLTNLLDNAIRHTHDGAGIEIEASLYNEGSHSFVQIEIRDEGQGIPPEDVPYVFERFYKADKARTRGAAGGTGLGLAIVRNIVDAHQGRITVKSTLGLGTTFTILLPTTA